MPLCFCAGSEAFKRFGRARGRLSVQSHIITIFDIFDEGVIWVKKIRQQKARYEDMVQAVAEMGGRATVGEIAEAVYGRNSKLNRKRVLMLLAVNRKRGREEVKKVKPGVIAAV